MKQSVLLWLMLIIASGTANYEKMRFFAAIISRAIDYETKRIVMADVDNCERGSRL